MSKNLKTTSITRSHHKKKDPTEKPFSPRKVSRTFLQAGAAAGTVARSISAYDMKMSDVNYGKAWDWCFFWALYPP